MQVHLQPKETLQSIKQMKFLPNNDKVESGMIHYQKEWNYLTNTVIKTKNKFYLEQRLKEKGKKVVTLKKVILKNYDGNITLKISSRKGKHDFYYSLNNDSSFIYFTSMDAIKILDRNYTGALLGLYTTSNGVLSQDYADFDWIRYKDFIR